MSIFTMSLAEALEWHPEDIGLNDYPVLGEEYRTRLNAKIIDQYINREIGQETFSLFRHAMRRKMAQIMPQYNQLYATETLVVDPLRTIDIHTLSTDTREQTQAGETVSESEGVSNTVTGTGSKSRNVGSDTPQVLLSGQGNYASSAADSISDATATADGTENASNTTNQNATTTDNNVMDSRVTGWQGSQAQLISDFRAIILNIDMMIVNELETLFMGVWNNGDSYTPNQRGYQW